MTLNKSQYDTIQTRRELVARLRTRGLTVREIAEALPKSGMINQNTGKPFTWVTVQKDLEAMREVWRENAQQHTSEHQARQLAEIEQVKRLAWQNNDGTLALKAIGKEIDLLGTAAPQRIEIGVSVEIVMGFTEAIKKLGRDPEQFMRATIERAGLGEQYLQ